MIVKRLAVLFALLAIGAGPLWAQEEAVAEEEALDEVVEIKAAGETHELDMDAALRRKPVIYTEGVGRDPFKTPLTQRAPRTPGQLVKPVPKTTGTSPASAGGRKVEVSLARQHALLTDMEKVRGQIEKELGATPVDEKAVLRLNDDFGRKLDQGQNLITDPALNRRFRALVSEHEKIRPRLAEIMIRHLTGMVRAKADGVRKDFERGEYKRVQRGVEDVAAFIAKNQDLLDQNPTVSAEVVQIMDEVALLGRRAEIRMEFGKKTFVVSGVNWSPEVAMAILNGKFDVSVGSVLDEATVAKITPNSVVLEYKGELFEIPFFD